MTNSVLQIRNILDKALNGFAAQRCTANVMKGLEAGLQEIRSQLPSADWRSIAVPEIRRHQVMSFLLQDPFTRRSFEKPRGYPGDAELLDMAYLELGAVHVSSGTSLLGREIFEYTSSVTATQAVRARKEVLTREIESVLGRTPNTRVMSVACGHLRELQPIKKNGTPIFADFIAFDQDAISLKLAEHHWAALGVRPFLGGLKNLFQDDFGRFDLIYAAGLYDYLQGSTANALTARLASMLASEGTLLIANFLPDVWESGYMEAAMDWWLLQRSLADIGAFLGDTPSQHIAKYDIWADAYGRIGYLRAIKA